MIAVTVVMLVVAGIVVVGVVTLSVVFCVVVILVDTPKKKYMLVVNYQQSKRPIVRNTKTNKVRKIIVLKIYSLFSQ